MIEYHVNSLAAAWKLLTKKPEPVCCLRVVLETTESRPFAPLMDLEAFLRGPFVRPLLWPFDLASPGLAIAILREEDVSSTPGTRGVLAVFASRRSPVLE